MPKRDGRARIVTRLSRVADANEIRLAFVAARELEGQAGGAHATPIAHVTLDMRGVSCPGPILQAKKLLDGMKNGEVLQMVSDCPGAVADIQAWGNSASVEVLATLPMARGAHEFYLRKK